MPNPPGGGIGGSRVTGHRTDASATLQGRPNVEQLSLQIQQQLLDVAPAEDQSGGGWGIHLPPATPGPFTNSGRVGGWDFRGKKRTFSVF